MFGADGMLVRRSQAPAPDAAADAGAAAWDEAALGKPINQEDLAFVLLTFGYVIPRAFDTWGKALPRAEKEAFLHLWRVVGYVMGVREDLMTDNLDEATELYERILKRNAGATKEGKILMAAVMEFFGDYLTKRFGLRDYVPAMMILDQLGHEHARMVLPDVDNRIFGWDLSYRISPRIFWSFLVSVGGFWLGTAMLTRRVDVVAKERPLVDRTAVNPSAAAGAVQAEPVSAA